MYQLLLFVGLGYCSLFYCFVERLQANHVIPYESCDITRKCACAAGGIVRARLQNLGRTRHERRIPRENKPNRPFPSCLKPNYESEAKCKVFVMKISVHSYANKTNFHMKSFAFGLAFIGRFTATQKWPITFAFTQHPGSYAGEKKIYGSCSQLRSFCRAKETKPLYRRHVRIVVLLVEIIVF